MTTTLTVALGKPGAHAFLSIALFVPLRQVLWAPAQRVGQLKLCTVDGLWSLDLFTCLVFSSSFAQALEYVESICECFYQVVYAE